MVDSTNLSPAPTFYTVREAAKLLRCDSSTLYRAIREDAFPVVRIRSRYIVPAQVVDQMIHDAVQTGACVDVAKIAAQRRTERDIRRITGPQGRVTGAGSAVNHTVAR